MSFKRLQQSYAFNFLSLYGFIFSILFIYTFVKLLSFDELKHISVDFAIFSFIYIKHIIVFSLLGLFIAILILIFELSLCLKIENEKYLNLKYLKNFQIFGIILETFPIIITLCLIIISFII